MSETGTAEERYERASAQVVSLERQLTKARRVRAQTIRDLHRQGLTWVEIEKVTGLPTHRLRKMASEPPP